MDRVWITFASNGNIRKWQSTHFDGSTEYCLAAALEATASPVTDAMVEAAYEKVRKMPASVDTAVGDLDTIVRAALSASPPSSAVVTDAVAAALREATELLKELDLGRSIHNDRRPDQKIDGPLWAQIGRVVGTAQAALSAALPLTAPPASPALRDAAKAILAHKPDYADTLWENLEEALAEPVDPTSDAEQAAYWKGAYDRMAARNGTMENALTLAIATLDDLSSGHGLSRPIEQIIRELDACASSGGHLTAPPARGQVEVKALMDFICDDVLPSYGIASEVGRSDPELFSACSALTSPAEPALATGGEG